MKAILISILLIALLPLAAQDQYYGKSSDSDPAAKLMLEQIRAKYDGFNTLAANFRLELQFPGQPIEVQRGTLSRQGELVRFKLGDQEGIINQEAAYFILHASKEVQINDLPAAGETTGMLTPQNLFSFYEGDQYVLALQGEEMQEGKRLQVIEMKPFDRNASDFTKLRLLVNGKQKEIVSVKAFSRDGSTYTFHLDTPRGNAPLADGTFTFSKAEFPGYHVEDLRF